MVDDNENPQVFPDNETLESIFGKNAFFVTNQLDNYELVRVKILVIR